MSHNLHSQIVWLTTGELWELCTCVIGGEFHPVTTARFCRHQVHLGSFTCLPGEGTHSHVTVERGHQFLRDAWSYTQYSPFWLAISRKSFHLLKHWNIVTSYLYLYFYQQLTHVDDCTFTGITAADLCTGNDLDHVDFPTMQILPDTESSVCYANVRVAILSFGNGGVNLCTITASPADSTQVNLTLCKGLNLVWHTWGYRKKAVFETQLKDTAQMWYKCQKPFLWQFCHL